MKLNKSKSRNLTFGTLFALAAQSATILASGVLPAQASGNLIDQQDGNRFMTIASATISYTVGTNFNGFDALKFSPSAYPFSFVVNVRAVLNTQPVNSSAFTCNLYNGQSQSWISNNGTRAISTFAVDSTSISCLIIANSAGQSEFEIGSARTNQNFGRVRIILDPIALSQNQGQGQGSSAPRPSESTPIKYSGPEFSGLSLKPVLNGTGTTLEGRKLDQISSITIDGKAAKLSDATDKSLKIELPAGLKPGVYDLVVNTASHGKLTHMNAIRIREELPATSLTIKGSDVFSGEEFKKLTAFSRTQNSEMNTAICIVNSSSEGKSFMQARALCDRIAASNLNIKTTMFETRSTVEGSAVFARVIFSSDQ